MCERNYYWKTLWVYVTCICLPMTVLAQNASIQGSISDEKSELLPGSTIFLEGSTKGVAADVDGKYILRDIEPGEYTLKATFIGYVNYSKKVTVNAGDNLTINIVMKPDYMELEGVVVTGYKSTERKFLTGATVQVKSEQIQNQSLPSFEQLIQGRAAGVNITAANGVPGSPVRVTIRGTSSISAGSEPLYVVDGIPITTGDFSPGNLGARTNALADINPNDIESIDVLKDAAATAIYGSRGANGVVLITTKRGKAGATKFSVNYYGGIVTQSRRLNYIDAETHLALRNQARRLQGAPDESPTAIIGPFGYTRAEADEYAATGGSDWVDATTRTGNVNEVNLSASGGTEKNVFFFNTTYRREKGFLLNNDFQRISGRFNMDNYITKKLTVGINFSLGYIINDRVPTGTGGGFGRAQELLPYLPITNPNGEFFNPDDNPVWKLNNSSFRAGILRNFTGSYLDYKYYPISPFAPIGG